MAKVDSKRRVDECQMVVLCNTKLYTPSAHILFLGLDFSARHLSSACSLELVDSCQHHAGVEDPKFWCARQTQAAARTLECDGNQCHKAIPTWWH